MFGATERCILPRDQQRSDVAVAPTMMKKVGLYRRALVFWRSDSSLSLVICGPNKQSTSHAITRCDDVVSYLSNEISSSLNRARNTPKSTRPCQWRWRPGDGKKSELLPQASGGGDPYDRKKAKLSRPCNVRWRPSFDDGLQVFTIDHVHPDTLIANAL